MGVEHGQLLVRKFARFFLTKCRFRWRFRFLRSALKKDPGLLKYHEADGQNFHTGACNHQGN